MVAEKIYHIFQNRRNLHIINHLKAGRFPRKREIYQPFFHLSSIYLPSVFLLSRNFQLSTLNSLFVLAHFAIF